MTARIFSAHSIGIGMPSTGCLSSTSIYWVLSSPACSSASDGPALRRRNAAIVLLFMLGNYGARLVAHERAIALAPRIFGPALPTRCDGLSGAPPDRSMASPRHRPSLNPRRDVCSRSRRCLISDRSFRWRLVARLSNSYLVRDVDVLDARLRGAPSPTASWRLTTTYPNNWTPQAFEAARTAPAQAFLGFSRLPAVRWVVDPQRRDHGLVARSEVCRAAGRAPRQSGDSSPIVNARGRTCSVQPSALTPMATSLTRGWATKRVRGSGAGFWRTPPLRSATSSRP